MVSIDISDVAYFYSENRFTFIRTVQNQKFIIDVTLDELEKELAPGNSSEPTGNTYF